MQPLDIHHIFHIAANIASQLNPGAQAAANNLQPAGPSASSPTNGALLATVSANANSNQFSIGGLVPPQPFGDPVWLLSSLMNNSLGVQSENLFEDMLKRASTRAIEQCFVPSARQNININGELNVSSPTLGNFKIEFKQVPISPTTASTDSASKPQEPTPSKKRKSYQPVKHHNSDDLVSSPGACSSNGLQASGTTSPDSALDLSRAGSLTGNSAPITPLKMEQPAQEQRQSPLSTVANPFSVATDILKAFPSFVPLSSIPPPSTPMLQQLQPLQPLQQLHPIAPAPPAAMLAPGNDNNTSPSTPTKRRRLCAPVRRLNSSRRFECNQCNIQYNSLHALEDHTLEAHGSYRCHMCQANFTQRSNLQRHALKHVGFKPFECRICNKSYYRKDHLMRHMEMVHPGFSPRDHIVVHLTSSESLEYLSNRGGAPVPTEENGSESEVKDQVEPMEVEMTTETSAVEPLNLKQCQDEPSLVVPEIQETPVKEEEEEVQKETTTETSFTASQQPTDEDDNESDKTLLEEKTLVIDEE